MKFLLIAIVVLVVLLSSKFSIAQTEGWILKTLRINAIRYNVEPELLQAVAWVESRHKPRAYNPEGFTPPSGRPVISGEVPQAMDLTGYQGSFGLCQIFHGKAWSTARAFGRPGGDYPTDLMDPDHNAEIAARFLSKLQEKGFRFPDQIDVYNVGESSYSRGGRNKAYVASVKSALEGIRNAAN